MANPWDGIISEEEQRTYNAAGFGRSRGGGFCRPEYPATSGNAWRGK